MLVTLPVTLYFASLESSSWQATWGKRTMGLRVVRTDGARLNKTRALTRTALKFIPWELTHTLIRQLRFAPQELAPMVSLGFILVWLLVGANVVSLAMSGLATPVTQEPAASNQAPRVIIWTNVMTSSPVE